MKGIILAGGSGSRLHPVTRGVSKQLMPVYDKPMIYYPLSTLMLSGIREVLVITTPDDRGHFERLLGDGSQWGISLSFAVQESPRGLADAFIVGAEFVGHDSVALVLGDNIFHGPGFGVELATIDPSDGAVIFAYEVSNPSAYGVVEFDEAHRVVSIEEKPENPKSRFAVPGLYYFDNSVIEIARSIEPSARGELEITAVTTRYLYEQRLTVRPVDRGAAWLDTGTFESMMQAAEYVRVIDHRQGFKVGCVEEIAWRSGWISDDQLRGLASALSKSGYGAYLDRVLAAGSIR
jgi:glucose-1-phosphate thymidylyltransferase